MRRLFIGLAVVVALATACGQSSQPTRSERGAVQHTSPSPSPSATVSYVPARLQIAKIGIDASVEQVGVDKNNNMDVPKVLADAAWYSPGVKPGQPGDAVVAGHKDSESGAHGVFWSLTDVQPGDEVGVVSDSGTKLRFKVTDNQSVPYNADTSKLGLFATSGAPRLTLITCTGQVNASRTAYLSRLIVNASYEGPG
jgi:sortase A